MNKNKETWWVTVEFAKQNPPLVAKRSRLRAQSAFLIQYGPAFSVGRSHPQAVFWCVSCKSYCVADESAVRSGRTISCGCRHTIHGLSGDKKQDQTYRQWRVLRRRHKDGIKVQAEWIEKDSGQGIKHLIADLGEAPPGFVMREIVAGGGYVRGNVRWIDVADAKQIHTQKKAKHVRLRKSLRRTAIQDLPEFAATAKCECGSFDTTTLATQPAMGTRYHRCNVTTCGKRFRTRMAEVSQIGGE